MEIQNLPAKLILYVFILGAIWLPATMGWMEGYTWMRILLTVVLIPIVHFVVDAIANK